MVDNHNLAYNLVVLGKMIDILPTEFSEPLKRQHNTVLEAMSIFMADLSAIDQAIITQIEEQLTDIKYVIYDLEVTRRERDELRRQLDDR